MLRKRIQWFEAQKLYNFTELLIFKKLDYSIKKRIFILLFWNIEIFIFIFILKYQSMWTVSLISIWKIRKIIVLLSKNSFNRTLLSPHQFGIWKVLLYSIGFDTLRLSVLKSCRYQAPDFHKSYEYKWKFY